MLQIKINGDKIIRGAVENGTILLNDVPFEWDIHTIGNNTFHIIKDNISYRAELIDFDRNLKELKIKINNTITSIQLKDKNDLLIEQLGLNNNTKNIISEIKAPMPGLIISLQVVEGQEVEAGEPLVILEAMKMENIIKSPSKAIVKSIHIKAGQSVEKNQVLLRF